MARPKPRRVPKKSARRTLLVYAEGKVTEPGYLNHIRKESQFDVNVVVHDDEGVPKSLVPKAVAAKKADRKSANREEGAAFDEVWCIFDVDEHVDLKEVVNLARDHGINLAISNPCVELWFLLHFEDQTAYIHRHDAQKKASQYTHCEKSLDADALRALFANYDTAKGRAIVLERRHAGVTEFPEDNPSSSVWLLIDSIRTSEKG